ncbi:MAG: pseudouridine synthase [Planctomycetota bacterium]|jgi:tRNA pseudouridine65 synthase
MLEIVHRDDRVVVVDKPGGLLVHRTRQSADRVFLLQMLRDQLGQWVFPVHRLDRAASGVIAFGLSSAAARELQEALQAPDAVKEYVLMCRGEVPGEFVSERPLTSEGGVRQPARTEFERLETVRGFSLVRARLRTGRRHQIRRHLAHLGHHIVGDTRYGKGRINRWLREEYGLPRMFLHAARLECRTMSAKSPLPKDLSDFLSRYLVRHELGASALGGLGCG